MKKVFIAVAMMTVLFSCSKDESLVVNTQESAVAIKRASTTISTETFELGAKTSYTAGAITFGSGSWYLNDALIGNSTSDKKLNAQSIRIRNLGMLTSQFNYATGVSTIQIYSGIYGTDAASAWELYYSVNSGSTWTKAGSTVTATTTLTAVTFTLNISGNVRFEIRKISGGSARLNIDNITVNSYETTTPPVDPGTGIPGRDNNMALGNPSGATADAANYNNYLMVKNEYTLSYNRDRGTSNWTSWHLSKAWLGSASRPSSFSSDATLPTSFYHVNSTDYSGSGFDRGHLCPAGDRTYSATEIKNTMLMTNMMPQAPINNQQPWEKLETYCRTLANAGSEMYIIDGPFGKGGSGTNGGTTTTVAGGKVTVPSYTWKIVVVLPNGSNDISRITSSTRVIALWMPNNQSVSTTWGGYRTTVDYIESQTGFDFLSNLPTTIQAAIESKVDAGATN
ncbi:DNA/RNA non-specific endonuclease [Williamwhitmania taraxaci]|uniref:Endonuclease G n=1 Tax=Williamwhitmania taraxaci TaxID=1640674 RepID=A0A1G6LD31_9BACT|nr:DNA/RNA non-specific endonuclease [Williamwhitmania taraxaci]SDC40546.1 endonuclease G [Williamwhitmania taraxaci]